MNARIEKLMEQCQIETYGINGELLYKGFDAEQFFASIVEDCISVVDMAVQCREPASTYVDKIKQHFGLDS